MVASLDGLCPSWCTCFVVVVRLTGHVGLCDSCWRRSMRDNASSVRTSVRCPSLGYLIFKI